MTSSSAGWFETRDEHAARLGREADALGDSDLEWEENETDDGVSVVGHRPMAELVALVRARAALAQHPSALVTRPFDTPR